jgi:DNA-binding IclR family transcriptional regulator
MNTAERVVSILNYLASTNTPVGVTEIGKHLGLAKATVHRILTSLEKARWISQNPETQRYSLSSGIMELGLTMLSRLSLQSVSLPHLEQVRDIIGETTHLSIRVDLERIYLYQVPGKHDVNLVVSLGRRLPLWVGAVGKSMLAHMRESEIETVIAELRRSGISTLPSGRVLNIEQLLQELDEIRKQGFAVTLGERTLGACAMGTPIFDHEHKVLGALGVVGPSPRFNLDLAKSYGALIKNTGEKISLQMGAGNSVSSYGISDTPFHR